MIHLTPGKLRNDSALEKIFNAILQSPSHFHGSQVCSAHDKFIKNAKVYYNRNSFRKYP